MTAVLRGLAPGALLSLALWAAVVVLWSRERAEQARLQSSCEALEATARTLESQAPRQADLEREVETLQGQLEQLRTILPLSPADAERELRRYLGRRGVRLTELSVEDAGELSGGYRWLRISGRVQPVGRSGLEAFADAPRWPLFLVVERLSAMAPRDPESELAFSVLLIVGSAEPAS